MSQQRQNHAAQSSHSSSREESSVSSSIRTNVIIDPVVGQWLQSLVQIAMAIAGRESNNTEETNGKRDKS